MDVSKRARVHAALGDPGRLAIVDLLTAGDAAPGELGAALGLPTNLIAHHVTCSSRPVWSGGTVPTPIGAEPTSS
ncbi:hypothetical protein AB0E63_06670 [Kribbella sp. NPDC026596]|uniref:ArsR/SmtB family transcription factor n=1 Tax=Kribbella sp. NPDC026596 TaxID=3155122 RepID=UPI0033DB3BF4